MGFSTCASDVVYQTGSMCSETMDAQQLTFQFLLAVPLVDVVISMSVLMTSVEIVVNPILSVNVLFPPHSVFSSQKQYSGPLISFYLIDHTYYANIWLLTNFN